MDVTFCELRSKEVINTLNGKKMGRVVDLVISCRTRAVLGLVLPGNKQLFKTREDLFIPWEFITRIGDDTILVNLPECPKEELCPGKCIED